MGGGRGETGQGEERGMKPTDASGEKIEQMRGIAKSAQVLVKAMPERKMMV
jgi:hypothetical protein